MKSNMKPIMNRIVTAVIAVCSVFPAAGQGMYSAVLGQIEKNSTALAAMKEKMEAQKLANRTGLNPGNPEIEFGYLWGHPGEIGHRNDLSVSQSFDFPTVYAHKAKLSGLQNNSAEYQYESARMELLLSAKMLCIDLVYNNAMALLYKEHLEITKGIASAYEKMKEKGEAGMLEYNKAMLSLTSMENEVRAVTLEQERLQSELARLNGGIPVIFNVLEFSTPVFPANFEEWYEVAEESNPALKYLKSEVEVSKRQVKLEKASALPKLSVGYSGEFVMGENYQGVSFGVSIPLWENKNKVKHAKADARAGELLVEDAKIQYYNRLKNLYGRIAMLQENIIRFDTAFEKNYSCDLLYKAFDRGEISLLEYLLETEYYLNVCSERLGNARDLEMAVAELTAAML